MHRSTMTRMQSELFSEEPAYLNFIFEIMYLGDSGILEYNQYPIFYFANSAHPRKGRYYWTKILGEKTNGTLFSASLFYKNPHSNA